MTASARSRWFQRCACLLVAAAAIAASMVLVSLYPLARAPLLVALCAAMAWALWKPHTTGWLLATLLPVASWAPLTGWWLVDEFDLLVLAVLAGGYARACVCAFAPGQHLVVESEDVRAERAWAGVVLALGVSGGLSLAVGLRDAGVGWHTMAEAWASGDGMLTALHADHASAFNTLRVSKSLLWACLLYPLLRGGTPAQQREAAHLTVVGMACGLACVCGLVLWERARYVGVFDVGGAYRTVASFWEMHVGGGAIDAYLVMTVPVAFWAVWLAPGGWRWMGAAVLAVLSTYAVLTTYSRGLYIAVAAALLLMAILAWRFRIHPAAGQGRRRWALGLLALALVAESAWVLFGHSFMSGRLARSEADLVDRVTHWRDGVGLLRTPADAVLGLGAGRLPAHYSAQVPGGEFPGRVQWRKGPGGDAHAELYGPLTQLEKAYDFGLTQRVDLKPGTYRVRVRYLTDAPLVLLLSVCERHLLYDLRCQWRHVHSTAALQDAAQWHEVVLRGSTFADSGRAASWREGMFTATVLSAGGSARLLAVELIDPRGRQVLSNTDFSAGLGRWFPAAQAHFKPWHMDNLYLEVLIERGLLGVIVMTLLVACSLRAVWLGLRRRDPLALALAGSLTGMGVLGLVISVAELPRLAFLLMLVLLTSSRLRRYRNIHNM